MIAAVVGLALAGLLGEPDLPSFAGVRDGYRPSEVQVLDRHGVVVHELRVDESRRRFPWTPLAEISPALLRAVLTSEDRRFFRHGGVAYRSLAAAALDQIAGRGRRGASTISMQVAAMLEPALRRRRGPRSLSQKWRQMRGAWALERRWPKSEILEAYLNLVTFRGELQGVAAASSVLFGKVPHGLTEPEAMVLAALIRGPNARAEELARRALAIRDAQGGAADRAAITDAAARAAGAPRGRGPRVALASHAAARLVPATPRAAGPIRSTLDATLQRLATESLERQLLAVRSQRVRDGAVLVADNRTGDVLAYAGGSGPLSSAAYVDGARARRQAGSSLKPFLYALAFDQRLLTPASLLADTPLDLPVAGGLYRPRNYDNTFRGLVPARVALASSLNVPAVRVLDLLGPERFLDRLRRLGIQGLTEAGDYYGPALALGSADVTLWELANAYRALANGGVWSPLRLAADDRARPRRRVFSPAAAFLVGDILSDRESRSATFGLENALATPFWAAVKTGTSKDMRDNWCVGFSRRYTVGVWVGNFSGEPMHDVSGVTGAAPVWLEIMTWLHRSEPSGAPAPPPGLIRRAVDPLDAPGAPRPEWFIAGTEPVRPVTIAAARPRITHPAPGTIVAVDPDIPPAGQRVVFEARAADSSLRWYLDDADLGPAADRVLWRPVRGRHTLALGAPDRAVLDRVTFEVR